MEDLNLRREFWEAMGWRAIEIDDGHWCLNDGKYVTGSDEITLAGAWRRAPPVETDEGIALRELVKFCEERNYVGKIRVQKSPMCCNCEIEIPYRECIADESDTTPARAICRAVISAVKGQRI